MICKVLDGVVGRLHALWSQSFLGGVDSVWRVKLGLCSFPGFFFILFLISGK